MIVRNGPAGRDALQQYLAEFLGTAILVFFAAGSVMVSSLLGHLPGAAVSGASSGLALMILIWSFAGISGAHFNPALTLTLVAFGDFPRGRAAGYILAQLAGSAAAGAILFMILGPQGSMGAPLPNGAAGITPIDAFLIECFLSFVMMLVIRGSLAAKEPLCQFAALPIGAIVGVEVLVMGPVAGAAMNPARAFGPYLFLGAWQTFWIYVIGPVIGIMIAALLWNWLRQPQGR